MPKAASIQIPMFVYTIADIERLPGNQDHCTSTRLPSGRICYEHVFYKGHLDCHCGLLKRKSEYGEIELS